MLSYSVLAYRFGQVSNPKMSSLAYHCASGASWRRFFFPGWFRVRSVTTTHAARNYGFDGFFSSFPSFHSLNTPTLTPKEHNLETKNCRTGFLRRKLMYQKKQRYSHTRGSARIPGYQRATDHDRLRRPKVTTTTEVTRGDDSAGDDCYIILLVISGSSKTVLQECPWISTTLLLESARILALPKLATLFGIPVQ